MGNWFEQAIIYSVEVQTFKDSNDDGRGDLAGLTRALDYLANLGVTCLWILPFYRSPFCDNGYDVVDYYQVDDRFGSPGDFVEFLHAAKARGLHVIIDLPLNHTSTDHPWFQEARASKDSPFRDFYIWSEEKPEETGEHVIFGSRQSGNWAFDEKAGAYYYHTFYSFEADLNLTNPRVRQEIRKIVRYWLELGVSGFRLDAVPHMLREKGNARFDGDPHEVLREVRRYVSEQRPDAVLLGEVDTHPQGYRDFFGGGDELHSLLNFYLCNYLFLAFARQEAAPIRHALEKLPYGAGQFANFLRNHDELDLERLTEGERREVYEQFAPEESMRVFGRGIRRRLAPMLGGERRRLELAHSLLLTLPGTPVLRYGEEIGMGDDLSLDERLSVRTPMQWSKKRNAGFSNAAAEELVRPVISGGEFGFERVNVAEQRRDPDSLLNWVARATRARRSCPEFGHGSFEVLEAGNERVLAHLCRRGQGLALAVHNLAEEAAEVVLEELELPWGEFIEMLADCEYRPLAETGGKFRLQPCGYRWFRNNEFPDSDEANG